MCLVVPTHPGGVAVVTEHPQADDDPRLGALLEWRQRLIDSGAVSARSFKEAQAYIIPLMLLCLVPGIICLMPSLEFSGPLAVIPLVNIVLLARDLLEGSVNTALAAAAVFSTLLYVVAAIAIAARIFGTDAILYGGQSTWSDLLRRPAEPQAAASTIAGAQTGIDRIARVRSTARLDHPPSTASYETICALARSRRKPASKASSQFSALREPS